MLCIVAMTSATISPACAFISGKYGDWIQICSGLQIIMVQNDVQTDLPDVIKSGCEFCFQHAHMVALHSDIITVIGQSQRPIIGNFIHENALIAFLKSYQSQAPPAFFLA